MQNQNPHLQRQKLIFSEMERWFLKMVKINVNERSDNREHRIGTRYRQPDGAIFKYAKIDFGTLGKVDGKMMRLVQYQWLPWNRMAVL